MAIDCSTPGNRIDFNLPTIDMNTASITAWITSVSNDITYGIYINGNVVLYYGSAHLYCEYSSGIFRTTNIISGTSNYLFLTATIASTEDFKLYYNGVSKDITVITPPTVPCDDINTVGVRYPFTCEDLRIYNRSLSSDEVAELYNSRCQRVVMDGLVFWPEMDGAAGLSSFDGATLSSANTIIDRISGVQGVPSGSPIGRGNTIQRIY